MSGRWIPIEDYEFYDDDDICEFGRGLYGFQLCDECRECLEGDLDEY